LPNQSQKPNKLWDFIKTNEEAIILKAIQSTKRIFDIPKNESIELLVESVAKWRAHIGLPKEDASMELAIIVEFLCKHWNHITITEFDLAWNLSICGKLEDCEFYGNFSPLYVGKVLSSYLHYRKITLADAIRKKENYDYEQEQIKNKPGKEEQAKIMQEILKSMYDRYKEKGEIIDPFTILYNFFRKHKWLKVNQAQIDEALEIGNKKYYNEKQKEAFVENVFIRDKESMVKMYGRNYLVQKYLDSNNIDVLINNIKPELFDGNNGQDI
jgi:hypothetical protein